MGRPTQSQVQVNGQTYSFSYAYDLSGALTSETYPSGRVIRTTYDGAGRANAVTGTLGTQQTNYVSGVQYWPHGAPEVYQYGNNVWPVNTFDNVLRPALTYSTVGNNPNYWLFYVGNTWNSNSTLGLLSEGYGPGVPYANMTWHNTNYGYDPLNRLTSASDTSWSRTFFYDEYGNMSVTSNSNVPLNGLTPQILQAPHNPYNPANNRLAEANYDAAGNMSTVGALSFWYDAEGRQTQSYDAGSQVRVYYTYDADGQRVQKAVSNGPTTIYIHDAFGQLAAEYASSAPAPPCTTCYLSYDHLGSVRLITDQNANVVSRHDYLPFGEGRRFRMAAADGAATVSERLRM
jgi:YD repeat-containing protein